MGGYWNPLLDRTPFSNRFSTLSCINDGIDDVAHWLDSRYVIVQSCHFIFQSRLTGTAVVTLAIGSAMLPLELERFVYRLLVDSPPNRLAVKSPL